MSVSLKSGMDLPREMEPPLAMDAIEHGASRILGYAALLAAMGFVLNLMM